MIEARTKGVNQAHRAAGFALIEMLLSIAILLVISAGVLTAVMQVQKSYRSTQMRTTINQDVRAVLEMMAQDIGQAGAMDSAMLANNLVNIANSGSNQYYGIGGLASAPTNANKTITLYPNPTFASNSILASNPPFWNNEQIYVGVGSTQEIATVQSASMSGGNYVVVLQAALANSHVAGDPVVGFGIFPEGVLSVYASSNPSVIPSSVNVNNSATFPSIHMFGDYNGDGSLYYVAYTCHPDTQQLTRAITPLFGTQTTTMSILLENVTNCASTTNPPFALCYYPGTLNGGSNCNGNSISAFSWESGGRLIYVTQSVSVTLSVQSLENDPMSPQYGQHVQVTHSMLNIQPRNLYAAYNNSGTEQLQDYPSLPATAN